LWMNRSKPSREVTISRRGEGNARLAKQQSKNGAEGSHRDQHHGHTRRRVTVKSLDEYCHREHTRMCIAGLLYHLTPRQDPQHTDVHQEVERAHDYDRAQHSSRNRSLRIAHLSTQEAGAVISTVVVSGDEESCSQAHEECAIQPESPGGKVEG